MSSFKYLSAIKAGVAISVFLTLSGCYTLNVSQKPMQGNKSPIVRDAVAIEKALAKPMVIVNRNYQVSKAQDTQQFPHNQQAILTNVD